MHFLVAGILLLAVVANACKSPPQFSGDFNMFTYSIRTGNATAVAGQLDYDEVGRRVRVQGIFSGMETAIIQLYNQKKQYVIYHKDLCYVMALKNKFQKMQLDSNAKLVTGGQIGTAEHGLFIDRYAGERMGAKYMATVTQEQCVITSSVAAVGSGDIMYFSFTNVKLGNVDDKFEVPHNCREIPVERKRRSVAVIPENPFVNIGI